MPPARRGAHLDEGEGCAWWQGPVLVGLLMPHVLLLALLQVELVFLLQVEDGSGGHCNDQCLAGVFLQEKGEKRGWGNTTEELGVVGASVG